MAPSLDDSASGQEMPTMSLIIRILAYLATMILIISSG